MAYIIQRKDRFYVVDYDGIDAITGRERRKWRLVGPDRTEAEKLVASNSNEPRLDHPVH